MQALLFFVSEKSSRVQRSDSDNKDDSGDTYPNKDIEFFNGNSAKALIKPFNGIELTQIALFILLLRKPVVIFFVHMISPYNTAGDRSHGLLPK